MNDKAVNDPVVQMIADFRGYVSECCDYCKAQTLLYPEEGGLWICGPCMDEVMKEALMPLPEPPTND